MEKRLKNRVRLILNKIENTYGEVWADKRYTGEVRLEMAMNRCLKHIESLNAMQNIPSAIKLVALEYGWRVYMNLQEFAAPIERQDISSRKREVSLNTYLDRIKVIEEREGAVQHGMFSGGTGYRSVNWDTQYWMAQTKADAPINEYWNEKEARKKRPVKIYTKEELKKFL